MSGAEPGARACVSGASSGQTYRVQVLPAAPVKHSPREARAASTPRITAPSTLVVQMLLQRDWHRATQAWPRFRGHLTLENENFSAGAICSGPPPRDSRSRVRLEGGKKDEHGALNRFN